MRRAPHPTESSRRPRWSTAALALGAVAALSPAVARADDARPAGSAASRAAGVSDDEVTARIEWIQRRLDAGTPAADRWWYGWYTGFTALTVAQALVAGAVTDPGTRADMAVGAVSSALGVAPLGLFGFRARFAAADLREISGTTLDERRRKLRVAERLLEGAADDEAFGRSWVSHLAGVGVSVAGGVVLAVGYDRLESGLVSIASGLLLSELTIWTQPTDAIDARREYAAGAFRAARPVPAYGVALGLDGASLRIRF